MSKRRSEWPGAFCVDFMVILPNVRSLHLFAGPGTVLEPQLRYSRGRSPRNLVGWFLSRSSREFSPTVDHRQLPLVSQADFVAVSKLGERSVLVSIHDAFVGCART